MPPQPNHLFPTRLRRTVSLASVIVGSMVLRAAAGAMGENLQFYFNAIRQAAANPNHPLRIVAGEKNVYPISYTLGGLIIASFFITEVIGAVVLGAWSDRLGRKLFIILGPLFGALAVQITALTTQVWLLVVTRLLEGLSTGSNVPATLGYIAEATSQSPKLRARVASLYEIGTIGGVALGFLLGGWLWRGFGTAAFVAGIPLTSPAFSLNALVYLASFAILWLGLRSQAEKPHPDKPVTTARKTIAHYWRIASNSRVAGFALAWMAIYGVLGIWINLTARVLTDRTGFSNQLLVGRFDSFQTGSLRAGFAIMLVLGILLWSLFLGDVKRTLAMLIAIGGLFAACLSLFGLNHQPALTAPLVVPMLIGLALSILVMSGFTPAALAYLADITESHAADRGAIMGLYSVFLGLGQFFGVALGGPFVDRLGMDGVVASTVLLGIIAAFILARLHRAESRSFVSGIPPQPSEQ